MDRTASKSMKQKQGLENQIKVYIFYLLIVIIMSLTYNSLINSHCKHNGLNKLNTFIRNVIFRVQIFVNLYLVENQKSTDVYGLTQQSAFHSYENQTSGKYLVVVGKYVES